MKKNIPLIRFDWAIKKLLRNKANFDILEGFLSELLQETIKIRQILDSESNKETSNDKHNRVDLLVENTKGELIIIEVQNSKEYDYFHRILFGTSKAITEYIQEGDTYSKIKKVISITIAYFDLGQGKDYIYHGIHQFKGLHHGDILNLAEKQKVLYKKEQVYEIFPEYWLIKVSQFNGAIKDKLDEWIYFLKNGEVQDDFTAKGLDAAKVKLDKMSLTDEEQKEYKYYLKRLRDIASEQHTKMADAEDLLKAKEEGLREGFEQGREKGIEKGREEGIEKGRE
ncbi:MAG: Rpn family recombination-promoting nuclease/putative transposase, partial [Aureispira sp.]|nr:Rpn family recombination-promoting nuclease/putative transposase [Aureispira sp.]